MAYDSGHQQVVLFGGVASSVPGPSGDTWTFDGTNWTQQSPSTSPSPRAYGAMTYDEATRQTVLFGGYTDTRYGTQVDGDTWTWDGTNWTQQSPAHSPDIRMNASMAYDPATHQVVLFGGRVSNSYGDTWTWNGADWTQQHPTTGPAPRYGAAMAWDSTDGVLLLFGGYDILNNAYGDTWAWDGSSWTQVATSGPSSRYGAVMADDPASGGALLFGGTSGSGTDFGDTWEYTSSGWVQQQPSSPTPSARSDTTLVHNEATGLAVLFGGGTSSGQALGDTWEWISPQHTLNVSLAGNGSGSVTSNPAGISCPSTCSASYPQGTSVTLTASPVSRSSFAGWSGGGCSGTGTCTITMSADQTVTATFTASPPPVTHTLRVSLAGNGAGKVTGTGIQCPGPCANTYPAGTQVTLVASPAGGSAFAGWSGGGCSGTGMCLVPMSADQTVTATFNSIASQPSCTLSYHGNGVYVGPKRGHRHKRRPPKKGVLELTARCNQAVALAVAGTIKTTFRGRHKKFSVTVFSSAGAGQAKTLLVKLPSRAVKLLGRGARESASFVLVGANSNGVGLAATSIGRLRALRW